MKKTQHPIALFALLLSTTVWATDYTELAEWKNRRVASLTSPYGWLSLVGMDWLRAGDNRVGAVADNAVRLSGGPEHVGVIHLGPGKQMHFTPAAGVDVLANDVPVTGRIPVHADSAEETTVLQVEGIRFYAIERGGDMAIRIKDPNAATRVNFTGIDYFDTDEHWRITAKFNPSPEPQTIEVVNVLGMLSEENLPGTLHFHVDGRDYDLKALDGGETQFFIIFGDRTNGRTSYGPGRFLYVDKPTGEDGLTVIDFNKAYNPPCAFTEYSTCSLPPHGNRMPVEVLAGERKYGDSKY